MEDFLGAALLLLCSLVLAAGALGLQWWLAPRSPRARARRSGTVAPDARVGPAARGRTAFGFYLVALLFALFNAATVFFYPWAASFRELGWSGVLSMGLFSIPLLVALAYCFRRGAIEW